MSLNIITNSQNQNLQNEITPTSNIQNLATLSEEERVRIRKERFQSGSSSLLVDSEKVRF
jgi:hypothetical protein